MSLSTFENMKVLVTRLHWCECNHDRERVQKDGQLVSVLALKVIVRNQECIPSAR